MERSKTEGYISENVYPFRPKKDIFGEEKRLTTGKLISAIYL